MFRFVADARDGFTDGSANCNSCCSEYAYAVPGEANKWRIEYFAWLAGIRGRGLVAPFVFSFALLTPNPPAPIPATLPPTNADYQFQIGANTPYSGTVATSAVSPQSSPLTFALDPVNPPSHGVVAINSNGTFIYVPNYEYTGVDTFYYTTSDGLNAPIVNQVLLGVDAILQAPISGALPPGVINPSAPENTLQVYETTLPPNNGKLYVPETFVYARGQALEFSIACSPEALVNQIYRLTLAVNALECDGNVLRHRSSYDIRISDCGVA